MVRRTIRCVLHASHFSGLHAFSTVIPHVDKGHFADAPRLWDPYVLAAVTVARDHLIHLGLVDMVQFGARPPSIIGFFTQPFRPNLDATPTGLTAARPVGPLAELAVRGTGDDASLFNVT